jgi:acetyl-CoA carboxylase biotin carboxyl carrier protein
VPLDAKELRELLLTLNETDISEFILKADDFELTVKRGTPSVPSGVGVPMEGVPAPIAAPVPAVAPATAPPPAVAAPPLLEKKYVDLTSPIVGTFYRSPSPDDPPFVEVGSRVQKGETVCIIEAMKIMNELEAELAGEVMEILVQNGQPVEYGQVLMRINPASS